MTKSGANDTTTITEPLTGNYFVSAYPPFSSWEKDLVPELMQKLNSPPAAAGNIPFGLYVHIPYCDIRCMYCYYLSSVKRSTEQIDGYIDALIKELSMYDETGYFANRHLDFVYFGGGTPSLLTAPQIDRLTSALKKCLPWDKVREVTFECAPKTVTEAKLQQLKKAGITRISMGIQQYNDEILKKNGRVHLMSDIDRAFSLIKKVGFEVVNIDLIVGLLGESDTTFFDSLQQTIKKAPDSITIYQLEIPLNTPLYRVMSTGQPGNTPAPWDIKRARLLKGFSRLEKAEYQLRSAYTAVHRSNNRPFVYQDAQYCGVDLLGIGASAFSYLQGTHFQNQPKIDGYLESVAENHLPIVRAYFLSDEERLVREFVLQLKLGKLNASQFRNKFNVDIFQRFHQSISEFKNLGWMMQQKNELVLTKEGLLHADHMLSSFYLPEHQGVRYS